MLGSGIHQGWLNGRRRRLFAVYYIPGGLKEGVMKKKSEPLEENVTNQNTERNLFQIH
jgi:hypothetical protein